MWSVVQGMKQEDPPGVFGTWGFLCVKRDAREACDVWCWGFAGGTDAGKACAVRCRGFVGGWLLSR